MKPLPSLLTLALATAACAGGSAAQDVPSPRPQDTEEVSATVLPSGYGSLGQDDVSILLRTEELEVRFMPIDQRILPLLSPDTETALRTLARQNQAAIDEIASRRGVSNPALVLVSFYGRQASSRFDPQLLDLRARGRVFRPIGIVPLDPRWSSQELGVRGTARGIYVFEEPLPVVEPMTLTYDGIESTAWSEKLQRLERERTRVRLHVAATDTTRGSVQP